MTPQNGWRRLVGRLAGGAIAGTLFAGIGAPTAMAAPGDDSHRYRSARRAYDDR